MSDHILIYVIVLLNMFCQLMLIWRLKHLERRRWNFLGAATLLPLLSVIAMRLMIAGGVINARLAEQSSLEHAITQAASILLIAGPWLTTAAAVLYNRGRKVSAA